MYSFSCLVVYCRAVRRRDRRAAPSLTSLLGRNLSASLGGAILDPRSATHGTNTRGLANVLKIVLGYGAQAKIGHVGARNRSSFAVNDIDNARGRVHLPSKYTIETSSSETSWL
jgi:hypothetical protein